LLPEHGAALDVRKEEGDSAMWKVNQRPALPMGLRQVRSG
jgi:hypothetical protein